MRTFNKVKFIILVSVFIACAFCLDASAQSAPLGKIIKKVEVKNNKAISSETILAKLKTRPGKEFNQDVLNEDIRRLYGLGFFTDVKVDLADYERGVKVTFTVREKPVLSQINLEGNKVIKTKKLQRMMKSKAGEMLDYALLKSDIKEVKNYYNRKGFTQAEIDYRVDLNESTNQAEVDIWIDEKAKVTVGEILFSGNSSFKRKKLLKLMGTKSTQWWFIPGYFKAEDLELDAERIKIFYESQGFLDAKITPQVEIRDDGTRVDITIEIEEGKLYVVGEVGLEGNRVFAEEEILEAMDMLPGEAFSNSGMMNDASAIKQLYYNEGYLDCEVRPSSEYDEIAQKILVNYKIVERGITYIDKIRITGNTKTKDVVIRRELRVYPGERFNGGKLKRSKERLYNLGYFEEVTLDTEPGSAPDKKDLVVRVKETKTGEFSFGGGYSSVDRFVGFVQVRQSNFDYANWPTFTGDGQKLTLSAQLGTVREDYNLAWTEPWILDYPLEFGFDVYQKSHSKKTSVGYGYDEVRQGGDLRFGKELTEHIRADAMYRIEDVDISDVSSEASQDLKNEEGENTISSIAFKVAFDTRDNIWNPTKGWLVSNSVADAGGFLGGDKDFLKYTGLASYHHSLYEQIVVEFKLRCGLADAYGDSDVVPIYERFYTGGAYSVRGYRERRIGPRDSRSNDPIGGEAMVVGNIECTFPLWEKVIKGSVFFDTGNVWKDVEDFASSGLKSGIGLGARVKTPIGPIKLDFGYPLNDIEGEKQEGRLYFSVSHGF